MGIRSARHTDLTSTRAALAPTHHVYPVPVPNVVCYGPFLTADQEGVHGTRFSRAWVEVNLSFDAITPVGNDRTRSGMPKLKPTVTGKFRSMVDFRPWSSEDSRSRLDLWVPPQPTGCLPTITMKTISTRSKLNMRPCRGRRYRLDDRQVLARGRSRALTHG